jgi:hypothetical protein
MNLSDGSVTGPGADTWGDIQNDEAQRKPTKWPILAFFGSIFSASKALKTDLDLITPRSDIKENPINLWLIKDAVPFFTNLQGAIRGIPCLKKSKGVDVEAGVGYNEGSGSKGILDALLHLDLVKLTRRFLLSVNTVLACLLPTLAIVALANLHTKAKLLGAIGGFTAVFAIGISILTDAKRVDIFTATAA